MSTHETCSRFWLNARVVLAVLILSAGIVGQSRGRVERRFGQTNLDGPTEHVFPTTLDLGRNVIRGGGRIFNTQTFGASMYTSVNSVGERLIPKSLWSSEEVQGAIYKATLSNRTFFTRLCAAPGRTIMNSVKSMERAFKLRIGSAGLRLRASDAASKLYAGLTKYVTATQWAFLLYNTGSDIYGAFSGRILWRRMGMNLGCNLLKVGLGWAGMKLGVMAGTPLGPVGVFFGAVLGSAIGFVAGHLLDSGRGWVIESGLKESALEWLRSTAVPPEHYAPNTRVVL